jgi:hypothetical protein
VQRFVSIRFDVTLPHVAIADKRGPTLLTFRVRQIRGLHESVQGHRALWHNWSRSISAMGTTSPSERHSLLGSFWVVASLLILLYGECMARMISTTIRLHKEDVRALKRARAAGHSASELVRKGLRVVASRYYTGRRPPTTLLFESTDAKLGDESELFRDLED